MPLDTMPPPFSRRETPVVEEGAEINLQALELEMMAHCGDCKFVIPDLRSQRTCSCERCRLIGDQINRLQILVFHLHSSSTLHIAQHLGSCLMPVGCSIWVLRIRDVLVFCIFCIVIIWSPIFSYPLIVVL